ncbi:uncharacterized protein LOC119995471 [Tripterygium wilfordii]|uniref:uncharacterized protein LOC119995471 n=1 Tax=Tripterygium wilfordii TaxID=458696 RepID=UPI0018F854C4|nr:uncharacterized protein LOC119995471 [Tripterygium wilfordii]
MAELIHHKPKSKPTTNCFLGCFGFPSKQQFSRKKSVAKKNNKTTLCFSWSRFRIKRSSTVKTVPLDSTNVSSESFNLSFICPSPTKKDSKPLGQITAAAIVSSDNQSPKETKINNLHHSRRQSHDATCQKGLSFRRKIDSIRNTSHPGSPDTAKPRNGRPNVSISRSTTFPGPERVKLVGSPSTHSPVISKEEDNKSDPIVGMSIIIVTILIMLVWGRLCAILCTSAWFFFVPRLGSNIDHSGTNGSGSKQPDLNSKEYKKRVVLEGLLERNYHRHRSTL